MSELNVQLKSTSGDNLYPKTKAEVVENSSGQTSQQLRQALRLTKLKQSRLTVCRSKSFLNP